MFKIVIGCHTKPGFIQLLLWKKNGWTQILYLGDRAAVPFVVKMLGFNVSWFDKSVGDFHSTDGRNLTWEIDRAIHDYVEKFLSGVDTGRLAALYPACMGNEDISRWLRRAVTLELYDGAPLWDAFFQQPEEASFTICERSPLVADYIRGRYGQIRESRALAPCIHFCRKLAVLPRLALRYLLAPRMQPAPAVPTVAVPLFRGVDDTNQLSDLFWLEGSGIGKDNVLFYSEDSSSRNAKLAQEARAQSYGFASSLIASLEMRQRLRLAWTLVMFPLHVLFRTGLPVKNLSSVVLFDTAIEHKRFYTLWLRFFRAHNVKIHIDNGDTNLSLQPYVMAVEKECGGVDLMYEFSATGFIPSQLSRPVCQTQYVARGCWTHETMQAVGAYTHLQDCRTSFLAGFHKHFLRDRPLSPSLAAAVEQAERRNLKLIGVFDIACARARLLPVSSRQRFYEIMLSVIETCPGSFFIIKPQRDLKLPGDLDNRLTTLEAEGRCFRSPAGIDETLIQPIIARLDFAVGLGGFNSALIEAASEEVPHVFYDEWDGVPETFRNVIPPAMIANNPDALLETLHAVDQGRYAMTPGWPVYLDAVDPFRDAQGHVRIGEIAGLWMEEFVADGQKPREDMLASVIGRYRLKHGYRSVAENDRNGPGEAVCKAVRSGRKH